MRDYRRSYTPAFRERFGGCLLGLRRVQRRARAENTVRAWRQVGWMVDYIRGSGTLNDPIPGIVGNRMISRTTFNTLDRISIRSSDMEEKVP